MTWNYGTVPAWYRYAVWNKPWSKRNGVHYVGDEIILDWRWTSDVNQGAYRRLSSGFEFGVDEATILATDREIYTPYGSVYGSPKYSSIHAHNGNMSMKIPGDNTQICAWWATLPGDAQHRHQYFRVDLYATQYPAQSAWMNRTQDSGLWVTTDGTLSCGGSGGDFNVPIALNQWNRIEWYLYWAPVQADTIYQVRLYRDADSDVPDEVVELTNCLPARGYNSLGAIGECYGSSSWGADWYLDNYVAGVSDWPGPYTQLENQPPPNPISYTIFDYYGHNVSRGTFEEGMPWFKPDTPDGGWKPGWYRVFLNGPETDPLGNFETCYGDTNFCIIRDDEHFVAMPAGDTVGGYSTEGPDQVMKGVMGLGTSRIVINDVFSSAQLDAAELDAALIAEYWTDTGVPDAERPERNAWCAFTTRTVDALAIEKAGDPTGWPYITLYPKTTSINGANLYVTVDTGTNPDTDRIRVYYPDTSTLVETWDNLVNGGAAQVAINAGSTHLFSRSVSQTTRAEPTAQTVVGSAYHDAVANIVSTLYPLGVTRYEGPYNEPWWIDWECAHVMMLFQDAVHDGDANAKAIGPCAVTIPPLVDWTPFFDAGGGAYCDEISFHAYNAVTNGDMNLGKNVIQGFKDVLASYGLSGKALWQTESVGNHVPMYGIYHPRRSRWTMMETLMFEQMGVPRERDNWWYDVSHSYWDVPAWIANSDGSLEPVAVMGRVLAEETWGKPYSSALDFGTLGNAMFLGSVYSGTTGKCVALMATSYMTGASVVLSISGASGPFTVVDGFGREKVMPLSKGRLTIPLTDVPSYVRLPSAASVSVYRVNNHSPLGHGASVAEGATTKQIDGVTYDQIADGGYQTNYGTATGSAPRIPPGSVWHAPVPGTVDLIWTDPTVINRVIIWCNSCWQLSGTLIDFDVQTYDGSTWTTRKTVTKDTPPWMDFRSSHYTQACYEETYWDEQWVFDVKLPAPVSCRGVRLNVRDCSYGGEPLSSDEISNGQGGGQGNNVKGYRLQEIAVVNDNRYAGVG